MVRRALALVALLCAASTRPAFFPFFLPKKDQRHGAPEAPELHSYPVEGTLSLRDRTLSLKTTEIILNGGEYQTYSRPDGSFVFHDVKPGVYLLDVLSTEFAFSQVKINLPPTADTPVRCLEYKYPGAAKTAASYPINLEAQIKLQYFQEREKVGVHTLMQNPMMLMLGATGFIVFLMPKMMDSMDPEEMKKMQEQMGATSGDPAALLKNLFLGEDLPASDKAPKKKIAAK